jgi:hypothetical protein
VLSSPSHNSGAKELSHLDLFLDRGEGPTLASRGGRTGVVARLCGLRLFGCTPWLFVQNDNVFECVYFAAGLGTVVFSSGLSFNV